MKTLPVLVVVAALSVACTAPMSPADPASSRHSSQPAPSGSSLPAGTSTAPIPAPGTCHMGSENGNPLPDQHCTPGALNPDVNQGNIGSTICKSGWTSTVRPPVSVTNRIKKQIDTAYGLPTDTVGELDHDVSLELGGAPNDARNFWVEPGPIPNPKDRVENQFNAAVCSGLITLTVAQTAIAHDWVTAVTDAGLVVSGSKVCLKTNPSRCVR